MLSVILPPDIKMQLDRLIGDSRFSSYESIIKAAIDSLIEFENCPANTVMVKVDFPRNDITVLDKLVKLDPSGSRAETVRTAVNEYIARKSDVVRPRNKCP